MPEFYMIFTRKIVKMPQFFMVFAGKINKIPEFYMIIAGKYFSRIGGTPPLPLPPVSYAYLFDFFLTALLTEN